MLITENDSVFLISENENKKLYSTDEWQRLKHEISTELMKHLIPLIKENIVKTEKANLIEKYKEIFLKYQCEDIDVFLKKFYYPQPGARIVYINAVPPYDVNDIQTFICKNKSLRLRYSIDVNGKHYYVDSISHYKQYQANVEFSTLVQEIYDTKQEEEKKKQEQYNMILHNNITKIFPMIERDKLSNLQTLFNKLISINNSCRFRFEGTITADILNEITRSFFGISLMPDYNKKYTNIF